MREKLKVTKLYAQTSQSSKPIVVHEGGTSSGKTYAVMQYLLLTAATQKNKIITVVGQDIPNLKVGAYRDAKNIIGEINLLSQELYFINKSERTIQFNNGSIVEFNSYKDEQDAKSGKRTHAFFNEANGIPYAIYEQINMRTSEKTIIDFNPSARFWAHEQLYGLDSVDWIKSTFRDNPFILDDVKRKILNYEPTEENIKRGTANKYKWQVYGLGEVGRLEGLVFPGFEIVESLPAEYKWITYGLDFGFTNDPTSVVEARYAHGQFYLSEIIYESGLTNSDIYSLLVANDFDTEEEIIADSAEPKSIEELKRLGLYVTPAKKGPDSVRYGIDLMKGYKINIHFASKNLIEEFNSYLWRTDRLGQKTNKPIDKFNHGIDAARYAIMYKLSDNVEYLVDFIEL